MNSILAEEEFATLSQKPSLEKVKPQFGSSLSYRRFNDFDQNNDPIWHYHPEVELAYIERGNGKRHIGNHISYYTSGDLVMIGSNLPHYGFTNRFTSKNRENIIQFNPDLFHSVLNDLVELSKIKDLIERSKHGLSFYGKTKSRVGTITDRMALQSPFDQFVSFLNILHHLSESSEYHILNATQITLQASQQDHERIKIIFDHVIANFQFEITLEHVSLLINMTIPSFCRYFKKQTGKTFTQFVNEFRITHACKLLSETSRPISDICFDCGFNNFAHFNKQFKKITLQNPSKYRTAFKQVITI